MLKAKEGCGPFFLRLCFCSSYECVLFSDPLHRKEPSQAWAAGHFLLPPEESSLHCISHPYLTFPLQRPGMFKDLCRWLKLKQARGREAASLTSAQTPQGGPPPTGCLYKDSATMRRAGLFNA